MITHFDMSSGEVIEEPDRDPVEAMPRPDQEPRTALRLMTVDEAVALDRQRSAGLPADMAGVPVAAWLRTWR